MRVRAGMLMACVWCGRAWSAADGQALASSPLPPGHWEKLPPPAPAGEWIFECVVEPQGTPWIVRDDGMFFWDGLRFSPPSVAKRQQYSYNNTRRFYGGPDRGAYCHDSQRWPIGNLYRLTGGDMMDAARIPSSPSSDLRYYISQSGGIFVFRADFTAFHTGRDWTKWPIAVRYDAHIVDAGDKVLFASQGFIHAVDISNPAAPRLTAWPGVGPHARTISAGCAWGQDKLIVACQESDKAWSVAKLFVWGLEGGERPLADLISGELPEQNAHDLFAAPDGSAWVITLEPNGSDYEFWRIGPDAVSRCEARRDRFHWARWRLADRSNAIAVEKDGAVWLAMRLGGAVRLWAGELAIHDWRVGLPAGVHSIFRDAQGGIHAAGPKGVYRYHPEAAVRQCPAEFALWQKHPGHSVPTGCAALHSRWERKQGPWWTPYSLVASFGNCEFPCNFDDTPLAGADAFIQPPGVDEVGNLWFPVVGSRQQEGPRPGWRGKQMDEEVVYVKRLEDFRIDVRKPPDDVADMWRAAADPVLPGLTERDLRLFCRLLPDGPWIGGQPGGQADIRFPRPGDHEIELVGMDLVGGLSRPVTMTVRAVFSPPDTRVTQPGPYVVNDLAWRPPVEAVPSVSGRRVEILYQLGDGPWRLLPTDGRAVLGGLPPGPHVLLAAAREEGMYRDESPARLEFDYRADIEQILEGRLGGIGRMTPEQVCQAVEEIKLLGSAALPALKARLAERPNQNDRVSGLIKSLILEFEVLPGG